MSCLFLHMLTDSLQVYLLISLTKCTYPIPKNMIICKYKKGNNLIILSDRQSTSTAGQRRLRKNSTTVGPLPYPNGSCCFCQIGGVRLSNLFSRSGFKTIVCYWKKVNMGWASNLFVDWLFLQQTVTINSINQSASYPELLYFLSWLLSSYRNCYFKASEILMLLFLYLLERGLS